MNDKLALTWVLIGIATAVALFMTAALIIIPLLEMYLEHKIKHIWKQKHPGMKWEDRDRFDKQIGE